MGAGDVVLSAAAVSSAEAKDAYRRHRLPVLDCNWLLDAASRYVDHLPVEGYLLVSEAEMHEVIRLEEEDDDDDDDDGDERAAAAAGGGAGGAKGADNEDQYEASSEIQSQRPLSSLSLSFTE